MALIGQRAGADAPEAQATARATASLNDLLRLKQKARGFSFLPDQPVHSLLNGRHASRLRGRGLNFEELRPYAQGDDTRTIDWLATARRGAPQVRVYTEERDRSVLLLVDQRSSMFFGSRRAMKSVVAAEVAALAAWRVTSLGDRVGAHVFGDEDGVQIAPQSRDAGVVRVLSEIARRNASLASPRVSTRAKTTVIGGETNAAGRINEALRQAVRLATHDWLFCLISDAEGADDETRKLATRLTEHNDVLAIHVSDPLEHDLPDVGPAVFSSGEAQIESDMTLAFRRRFSKEQAERRARIAELSRKRTIPVLSVSTDRDVARQLRDQIGTRIAHRVASASDLR